MVVAVFCLHLLHHKHQHLIVMIRRTKSIVVGGMISWRSVRRRSNPTVCRFCRLRILRHLLARHRNPNVASDGGDLPGPAGEAAGLQQGRYGVSGTVIARRILGSQIRSSEQRTENQKPTVTSGQARGGRYRVLVHTQHNSTPSDR